MLGSCLFNPTRELGRFQIRGKPGPEFGKPYRNKREAAGSKGVQQPRERLQETRNFRLGERTAFQP